MGNFDYTNAKASFNGPTLFTEIVAAGLPSPVGARQVGTDCVVRFADDRNNVGLSGPQQTTLTGVVTAHSASSRDDSARLARVNVHLAELIEGDTFTAGGNVFAMDLASQAAWVALQSGVAGLTFPITMRTADNLTAASLANAAALTAGCDAMALQVEARRNVASTAQTNIIAAASAAAANTVLAAYLAI